MWNRKLWFSFTSSYLFGLLLLEILFPEYYIKFYEVYKYTFIYEMKILRHIHRRRVPNEQNWRKKTLIEKNRTKTTTQRSVFYSSLCSNYYNFNIENVRDIATIVQWIWLHDHLVWTVIQIFFTIVYQCLLNIDCLMLLCVYTECIFIFHNKW